MNGYVNRVVDRIHYLIMTHPEDLKLSLDEREIIVTREIAHGGSWESMVKEIEAASNHPRRCLAGWLWGYEGRHNVNLAHLLNPVTRTN